MMKSDIELTNQIEAYLRGELSPTEKRAFEKLRKEDPSVDQKLVAHHNLMKQITAYGDYRRLKTDLENIHSKLDVDAIKGEVMPEENNIRTLWAKHGLNIGVAASIAILAAFFTLLSTGYLKKTDTDSNVNHLSRRLEDLNKKVNQRLPNKPVVNPGEFAATGFAISTDGFIVTNFHVVDGADSVHIINNEGISYQAKTVYTDATYDIAILQITDPAFHSFKSLPYTIKKGKSELAENVYTIGFPRDQPVYNQGYLSAKTGYKGDTTTYQVTISVNNGNSGGPLLDYKGNVVGIISAKQSQVDGAAFAIRSEFLLKSVKTMQDSLEQKIVLNKKNVLGGLNHQDQVKKMGDYIFLVQTY